MTEDISDYHGPAREFMEGSPDFDNMLKRAVDMMNYFSLWNGYSQTTIDQLSQQDRLGLSRAMAIALERTPVFKPED